MPPTLPTPNLEPNTSAILTATAPQAKSSTPLRDTHEFLNDILWVQTAAEYRITCQMLFNLAKSDLDLALKDPAWSAALEQTGSFQTLPPAIIVDVDETILDNSPGVGWFVQNRYSFNSTTALDTWMKRAEATGLPGAVDFLKYAESKGVTIFFVTNRSSGLETATRVNLEELGLSLPTTLDTVLVVGEKSGWGSDKTTRRTFVAATHRILLLLGDDLNDFVSGAEDTPEKRVALATQYQTYWGKQWILIPNTLYGSWESALYGHQSPPDNTRLQKKFDLIKGSR
jgi:5'-nucleotidase (lipoprotein e(P4) family)